MANAQPTPRDGEAFDVVLVGGGTGGYVAAIRAKQLGLDVAVVEIGKIGGTCLHQGCIPTKAYLKSADVYEEVQHSAEFGVNIAGDVTFNYPAALERSLKVVAGQYKGLQFLFDKKYNIPVAAGRGKIAGPNAVEVTPNDGGAPYTLQARNIIVDTGTRPRPIKGLDWDGKRVINSDDAVVLEQMPQSFIIRGGGAVGVEWASIYGRYGAKVSLVGRVVPAEEEEAQQVLTRAFKRQGIDLYPNSRPTADDIEVTDSGYGTYADGKSMLDYSGCTIKVPDYGVILTGGSGSGFQGPQRSRSASADRAHGLSRFRLIGASRTRLCSGVLCAVPLNCT